MQKTIRKLGDIPTRYNKVTGFLHKTEECKHKRSNGEPPGIEFIVNNWDQKGLYLRFA